MLVKRAITVKKVLLLLLSMNVAMSMSTAHLAPLNLLLCLKATILVLSLPLKPLDMSRFSVKLDTIVRMDPSSLVHQTLLSPLLDPSLLMPAILNSLLNPLLNLKSISNTIVMVNTTLQPDSIRAIFAMDTQLEMNMATRSVFSVEKTNMSTRTSVSTTSTVRKKPSTESLGHKLLQDTKPPLPAPVTLQLDTTVVCANESLMVNTTSLNGVKSMNSNHLPAVFSFLFSSFSSE